MVAEDRADAVGGNLRLGKALPQMNQQLLEELLLLQLLRSVDDNLLWIVAHRVDQLLHLLGAAARGPQRDHRAVLAAQHRPDVEDGAHRLAHNADAAAFAQRVHAVQ